MFYPFFCKDHIILILQGKLFPVNKSTQQFIDLRGLPCYDKSKSLREELTLNTMFEVFEGKVVKSFTVDNNNVYFDTDSNGIVVYSAWTCCAESRSEVVSFTSGYVEKVEVTSVDSNKGVNGFDSNKGVYSVFLRSGDTTLVEM